MYPQFQLFETASHIMRSIGGSFEDKRISVLPHHQITRLLIAVAATICLIFKHFYLYSISYFFFLVKIFAGNVRLIKWLNTLFHQMQHTISTTIAKKLLISQNYFFRSDEPCFNARDSIPHRRLGRRGGTGQQGYLTNRVPYFARHACLRRPERNEDSDTLYQQTCLTASLSAALCAADS